MHTTPRQRVLKRVLLESLHRYRELGDLPEPEFSGAMEDYPAYLRAMADAYDGNSPDLEVEEKPGLEAYSEWAESYDHEPDNPVIAGEDLVFDQIIAPLAKTTVLDVGAGTGRHANPLARAGSHVTAVEPNIEMLDRAKAKADAEKLNIEFYNREVYQPLDDTRVFDLVLCCLVLSHVKDLERAVSALAAHVKTGGHLVITDFHPYNLLVGMRTSYCYNNEKYYVPNTIHLPSDYVGIAGREGLNLHAYHECGSLSGYPKMPATLVLAFSRPEGQ